MNFLKHNWQSILPLALILAYIGISIGTQQCPTCFVIDRLSASGDNMNSVESDSANAKVEANWETTLVDGTSINRSSLEGKVSVIVYFATWCSPCKKEVPELIALRNEFEEKDLSILAISMDQPGKELTPFIERYGINYQVAHNSASLDESYGPVKYLPTILIVDKNGSVAHRHTGSISKDVLKMQIRTLLM